jgi:hypothetical protein
MTNVFSSKGCLPTSTVAEFYPVTVVHYISIKLFSWSQIKTAVFVTTFSNSLQEYIMLEEYGE